MGSKLLAVESSGMQRGVDERFPYLILYHGGNSHARYAVGLACVKKIRLLLLRLASKKITLQD